MPGQISEDKLREAFKIIDTDGSGTLSNAELGKLLDAAARQQGIEISPQENSEICEVSFFFTKNELFTSIVREVQMRQ